MKVLGFRADPKTARYAIVSGDKNAMTLENANTESRLLFPAALTETPEKLLWLYREIERIFHAEHDIAGVVVKTKEFGLPEKAAMRESSYLEAAVILFCAQNDIPVTVKTYKSLGTVSKKAKEHAELRVGKTIKYWTNTMADAVIAAWWGIQNA